MRKSLLFIAIPVAAIGIAATVAVARRGATPANDKFAEDLQTAQAAGLDLAQAQGATKYALTEIAPETKPAPAKVVRQGSGTKAIRSKTPTVKAAAEETPAEVTENNPDVQVTETAAAPAPAPIYVPAVPRPVPQTTQGQETDQGPILAGGSGRGTGRTDGGIGLGGIFGAIIRGGTVDGDNCDPRPSGSGRRPMNVPVYNPNPNSGMGTGRIRPGMPVGGTISNGGAVARPRGGRY